MKINREEGGVVFVLIVDKELNGQRIFVGMHSVKLFTSITHYPNNVPSVFKLK